MIQFENWARCLNYYRAVLLNRPNNLWQFRINFLNNLFKKNWMSRLVSGSASMLVD
jgi:hypothetical protein